MPDGTSSGLTAAIGAPENGAPNSISRPDGRSNPAGSSSPIRFDRSCRWVPTLALEKRRSFDETCQVPFGGRGTEQPRT